MDDYCVKVGIIWMDGEQTENESLNEKELIKKKKKNRQDSVCVCKWCLLIFNFSPSNEFTGNELYGCFFGLWYIDK